MHAIVDLLTQIPSSVPARSKYFHRQDSYIHIVCAVLHVTCTIVYFQDYLLNGDVQLKTDPETLYFCFWNPNSIFTLDFLQVSFITAYNSVYNYDLIGIDESRLSLDGHSFCKSNNLKNVKTVRYY